MKCEQCGHEQPVDRNEAARAMGAARSEAKAKAARINGCVVKQRKQRNKRRGA